MTEIQTSDSESETVYEVIAWWNTQRGCRFQIGADTPEEALEIADSQIADGTLDLGVNEEFTDSDGATNLEIYTAQGTCELLSEDERMNRAAPALLTFAEAYLNTQPGPGYKEWIDPKTLAGMAREAAAEATGDSTGGAAAPTSDLRAAPATERGEG